MWGGGKTVGGWADKLSQTVTKNVQSPSGLIARIGEVVAPDYDDSSEDDESGSGSSYYTESDEDGEGEFQEEGGEETEEEFDFEEGHGDGEHLADGLDVDGASSSALPKAPGLGAGAVAARLFPEEEEEEEGGDGGLDEGRHGPPPASAFHVPPPPRGGAAVGGGEESPPGFVERAPGEWDRGGPGGATPGWMDGDDHHHDLPTAPVDASAATGGDGGSSGGVVARDGVPDRIAALVTEEDTTAAVAAAGGKNDQGGDGEEEDPKAGPSGAEATSPTATTASPSGDSFRDQVMARAARLQSKRMMNSDRGDGNGDGGVDICEDSGGLLRDDGADGDGAGAGAGAGTYRDNVVFEGYGKKFDDDDGSSSAPRAGEEEETDRRRRRRPPTEQKEGEHDPSEAEPEPEPEPPRHRKFRGDPVDIGGDGTIVAIDRPRQRSTEQVPREREVEPEPEPEPPRHRKFAGDPVDIRSDGTIVPAVSNDGGNADEEGEEAAAAVEETTIRPKFSRTNTQEDGIVDDDDDDDEGDGYGDDDGDVGEEEGGGIGGGDEKDDLRGGAAVVPPSSSSEPMVADAPPPQASAGDDPDAGAAAADSDSGISQPPSLPPGVDQFHRRLPRSDVDRDGGEVKKQDENGEEVEATRRREEHTHEGPEARKYRDPSYVRDLEDELSRLRATVAAAGATATAVESEEEEASRKRREEAEEEGRKRAALERKMANLTEVCQNLTAQNRTLQQTLKGERSASAKKLHELRRSYDDATDRADAAERAAEDLRRTALAEADEARRGLERELGTRDAQSRRLLEECRRRLERAEAAAEEREGEMEKLQAVLGDMRSSVRSANERAASAEGRAGALEEERDGLEERLHSLEEENVEMERELDAMSDQSGKMGGLQMELHMLKEARDRDREKIHSAEKLASSAQSKLASERDEARQQVQDMERQLAATLADLDLARADHDRAVTANANLQSALEAFQSERDSETALLEEQRKQTELATAAAHAAAVDAMNEANEARMREVQMASNAAVRNVMEEVSNLEKSLEQYRRENSGLRRSLDEAIHRLQTTQEDVIDRSLMKNILLDWHARQRGQGRKEVLEIMSSLLHFTEEEKSKIGLGDGHHGALGKMVGAVAAPLPPAALNVDKIEGDNVREKWVNFLLAETGGGDDDETISPLEKRNSDENGSHGAADSRSNGGAKTQARTMEV